MPMGLLWYSTRMSDTDKLISSSGTGVPCFVLTTLRFASASWMLSSRAPEAEARQTAAAKQSVIPANRRRFMSVSFQWGRGRETEASGGALSAVFRSFAYYTV